MKFTVIFAIFLSASFLAKAQRPVDSIDLSQHNFADDPITSLRGEWEFYWQQLLTPSDFVNGKYSGSFRIHVPQAWQRADPNFSVLGYGTYRTTVILPADSINKSIYLPFVCSSSMI